MRLTLLAVAGNALSDEFPNLQHFHTKESARMTADREQFISEQKMCKSSEQRENQIHTGMKPGVKKTIRKLIDYN